MISAPTWQRTWLLLLVFAIIGALGTVPSTARGSEQDACPSGGFPRGGFADVSSGGTHAPNIDCVAWWGIARGTGANRFSPTTTITRGQMATFIARVMTEAGHSLPTDPGDHFPDVAGTTHEEAINQLADAGVVGGQANGTYGPEGRVNRGQMATFLVRALEAITGETLASGDHFDDVADSPHAENINKAAEAGITFGVGARTFAPGAHVQRAQMATFLVNLLDILVAEGRATWPPQSGTFHHRIDDPLGKPGDAKLSIAVGPEHVVIVTNWYIAVRTLDGAFVDGRTMPRFFDPVLIDTGFPDKSYRGDPRVIFDPDSQRFFVVAMSHPYDPGQVDAPYCDPAEGCESYVLLAVSRSARPQTVTSSDWHLYSVDARYVDGEPTELQTDRTMVGVSGDAIIATAGMYNEYYSREFYSGRNRDFGPHQVGYDKVWVASKARAVNGTLTSADWQELLPLRPGGSARPEDVSSYAQGVTPTIALDPTAPPIVDASPGNTCDVNLYVVDDPLGSPSMALRTAVSGRERDSCGRAPMVTQRGGATLTSERSAGGMLVKRVYQDGSLWGVENIGHDFGGGEVAAIRWWEIDVSRWPEQPTIVQEGIIGEDGSHAFYPAISVDPDGNAAIVFGRSGPAEHPSLYYAWRRADDPAGTTRAPRLIQAGTSVFEAPDYGDFQGAATAPDGRLWMAGIVATGSRNWETYVAWLRPR